MEFHPSVGRENVAGRKNLGKREETYSRFPYSCGELTFLLHKVLSDTVVTGSNHDRIGLSLLSGVETCMKMETPVF